MPHVVAEPPPSWIAAEVTAPPIAEGTGAKVVAWRAWRAAKDETARDPTFVRACIATAIPGWVEDMRPATEMRMVGIVASTAERLANAPIEARNEGGMLLLYAAGTHGQSGRLGVSRAFLGFDEAHLYTCFAMCVAKTPSADAVACDANAEHAVLEGSTPPPHPGLALSAVTWGIHHPRETATTAAVLTLLGGVLAITTRRRPRAGKTRT